MSVIFKFPELCLSAYVKNTGSVFLEDDIEGKVWKVWVEAGGLRKLNNEFGTHCQILLGCYDQGERNGLVMQQEFKKTNWYTYAYRGK